MLHVLKVGFIVGVLIVAALFLTVKTVSALVSYLVKSMPENPTESL